MSIIFHAILRTTLGACLLSTVAGGAYAVQPPAVPQVPSGPHGDAPALVAAPVAGDAEIDGRLDEPFWATLQPATRFTQIDPYEAQPASERTEIRIGYTDDALLIGARLFDATGTVSARLARRDAFPEDSDWLSIMLDSHHDHLTAFEFSVNPLGVKRDEILERSGNGDESWDAVWDAAATIDAEGWTAELRIPFSQLRFGTDAAQTWGVQIERRISRVQERAVFAFSPKSEPGGVAAFGHLEGLQGLRAGKRLEVLPYTVARAEYVDVETNNPFRDDTNYQAGLGLDLKYRLTSALTLDATINPDFGQVEVDPAVVNLSAFETSFDEKRPFFVEGRDIFDFGGRQLFYSRRIGRAPQGSVPGDALFSDVPGVSTIIGAAKLTGRTGAWSIGLLDAVTAEEEGTFLSAAGATSTAVIEPAANYFVGRAGRTFRGGQTRIGALATMVNRALDDDALAALLRSSAYSAGLDFGHEFLDREWSFDGFLAASHIAGSESAIARAQRASARYFQRVDADHLELDPTRTSLSGYAGRVEVGKRAGRHWRGQAGATASSPGFEINDVGFLTGVDRLELDTRIGYEQNTPGNTFREWEVEAITDGKWNYGREFQEGRVRMNFDYELLNYWSGNISLQRYFDGYDDRLTRGGPLASRPGTNRFGYSLNSDDRKRVSARLDGYYLRNDAGGWNQEVSVDVTVRPAENWSISVEPEFESGLGSAQFLTAIADPTAASTFGRRYLFAPIEQTTISVETRLNVAITPELSFDLFMQPFVSTGAFGTPRQLRAPRTYEFDVFGDDIGTLEYDADARSYVIDPDGTGPAAPFTVEDEDFNERSLRGNAVMRWEWRPGSTLYIVWQQRRETELFDGRFDLTRDLHGVFGARPDNVFVVKLSYWLNL